MPTQVQLRGGSASENDAFTGALREVTVDTSNNSVRIHDGSTAGGHRLLTVREFTANINLEGSFIQANNIVTAGLSIKNDNHQFVVTVASKTAIHPYYGSGSSSAYFIDGEESPYILLAPGITYLFDQSDSSNSGHPLRFYTDVTKNNAYTTGVTTNGTPGSAGAWTKIVPTSTTTCVLYYQCSSHGYMGSGASVVNGYNPTFYQTANAQSDLANTNSAIADRMQVANTTTLVNDRMQVANVNTLVNDRMQVANVTTLVNDRMQVANVTTLVNDRMQVANTTTLVNDRLQVANATTLLAAKLDSSSYTTADVRSKAALANTNSAIADRLQVANATIVNLGDVAQGTTPTNGQILKYASGNNTFYFASESGGGGGGSSTLTGLTDVVQGVSPTNDQILKFVAANSTFVFAADSTGGGGGGSGDVANSYLTATFVPNTAFQSALANTNAFIATKLNSSSYTTADVQAKAALGNTNAFIATKLNSSSYTTADVQSKAALGNTNLAIADRMQVANVNTLVNDRMQVANVNTLVNDRMQVANVNTLVNDRLQVANATIGNLGDVVQGVTPTDNYILKYNAANTTWLYEADGGSGGGAAMSRTHTAFEGDGSTVAYTLGATPTNENHIDVVVDGLVQHRDTYSLSGATLTFSAAPSLGANVQVTITEGAASSQALTGQTDVVQGVTPTNGDIIKYNSSNTTFIFSDDIQGVYTDKNQTLDLTGGLVATTSNTIQIDASLGNFISANLNANVTSMTVSNIPATGTPYSFTLRFKYPDAVTRTVTWGSSVYWPSNTAPTLTCTANTVDTFVFYTIDGGSHILGFTAGQNHYLINEDG